MLRRIIRRAAMHGRTLGIQEHSLAKSHRLSLMRARTVIRSLRRERISSFNGLNQEEEKFAKTIDQGLGILADMEERMKADGVKVLSGEDAFKLYDTYGFPVDLTAEILEEKGFTYDEAGFESCMEAETEGKRSPQGNELYGC